MPSSLEQLNVRFQGAIIVDTREKHPFPLEGFATVVAGLKTGDYSLVGHEDRVAVERKSKEDYYGCVGADRDRFERELKRLSKLDAPLVVIECSPHELSVPPARTRIDSRMAMGSLISWMCQYRVPIIPCGSRDYAERFTIRWLAAYLKYHATKGELNGR